MGGSLVPQTRVGKLPVESSIRSPKVRIPVLSSLMQVRSGGKLSPIFNLKILGLYLSRMSAPAGIPLS